MFFDTVPIWTFFLVMVGTVLLAIEIGARLGRLQLRLERKATVSSDMVAATMSLLAFVLAFTFNGAAGRHDARKALVIAEANAIDTTWRRAGFLPDPYRTEIRGLLRDYVDVRVKATAGEIGLGEAARRSEALHGKMWTVAEEVGRKEARSMPFALFIQSLNEVIDLHLERITTGARNRVPPIIWLTLYLLLAVGMCMIGVEAGLSGTRHIVMEAAIAVSFSLVLFVIADLDRPQEGLTNVSQQAMVELRNTLKAR
jgi:hypothetical membrane protein